MDPAILRTVSDCPYLAPLAEEDKRWLATVCVRRAFQPGETLIRRGAPADSFFILRSGAVRLRLGDGADDAAAGLENGDIVGVEAVLERAPHAADVTAVTAVEAAEAPAAAFCARLTQRFDMTSALLAGASARLRGAVHEITDLKLKSTTKRLAGFLYGMAVNRRGIGRAAGEAGRRPSGEAGRRPSGEAGRRPSGEAGRRVVLPCEKHQLAERLGMQPESLSRAFARLRTIGVETDRGDGVIIADLEALGRYCQGGEDN
jgi:CRP-like cAMP-binding protein